MLNFFGTHHSSDNVIEHFYVSGSNYREVYNNLMDILSTKYLEDDPTEQQCKDFIFNHGLDNILYIYLIRIGVSAGYVNEQVQ